VACGTGEVCVGSAPAGWTGPVQLYEGAAPPPPCPPSTSLEIEGGSGLSAPPATCSTCTCGAPAGVTCGSPTVTLYTDSVCGGASCDVGTVTSTCSLLKTGTQCNIAGTLVYVSVAPAQATGGSCPPTPEVPSVPPAAWTTNALACAPLATGAACGAGMECTPSPAAPFVTCIYQAGNVSCPSAAYPNKSIVDTNWFDTRTCSACSCGAPGGCAGGAVLVSTNSACSSGVQNPIPSACKFDGIPGILPYYAEMVTPPSPNGCTPGGGQPTGGTVPTGPITLCCQ